MLDDVSSLELLGVVAAAGCAGFVSGLTGFGLALVSVGPFLALLPAAVVPPLVVLEAVVAQLVAWPAIRGAVRWPALRPYLAGAAAGIPLGLATLDRASPALLRTAVGVFLVLFCLVDLGGVGRGAVGQRGGRGADALVGAGGGFLGGFAGLSGPLPIVWLRLRGGPPRDQRAIYQPFNLLVLGVTAVAMALDGHVGRTVLLLAGLCFPATAAGSWLGVRGFRRLEPELFRRLVLLLLLLTGVALVVR